MTNLIQSELATHKLIFANQVAYVTGASRGIGKAIAVALAENGADLAMHFREPHRNDAEQIAQLIRDHGRRVLLCPGDVADNASVERALDEVATKLGPVDIAVANAAYSDRDWFYEADLEKVHRAVDVTMWGAFHVFRAAARQMIGRKKGGVLIGISSPLAFVPIAKSMPYNMAKAALDQMARTAALELAPHRIRVNLVHPGWIDTPGERKYASDAEIAAAGAKLLWGRLGRAEEIARGVLFLCDPASDYITGTSLLIDGGLTLPSWSETFVSNKENEINIKQEAKKSN